MIKTDFYKLLKYVIPWILILWLSSFFFLIFSKLESSWLISVVGFGLGLIVMYVISFIAFVNRNPTPLSISLLGFPASGKTVFLTVLFDVLMTNGTRSNYSIIFSPYGSETVERVVSHLNLLTRGKWLPKTGKNEVFYYRALASMGTGIFSRRLKIEIGDYAGENIGQFDTDDERWLHKTDYFKYVIQSEVILLSVDSKEVAGKNESIIQAIENSLIAAIQLVIENKGVDINKKLKAPVALIFMKCDLVSVRSLDKLKNKLSRLINLCQKRCLYFKIFMTSSVGHINKDGSPPAKLTPIGIVEPIIWALQRRT